MTVADFAAAIRDSLDLAAQQEMALWARWMFWATCGSLFLSAGALWGLLQSLKQTRQALATTEALAHAETRAYVHAIKAEHLRSNAGYQLLLHVENVGATPAPSFSIAAAARKVAMGNVTDDVEHFLPLEPKIAKPWNGLGPGVTTVAVTPEGESELVTEFRQGVIGHYFVVAGTIAYSDIYGNWFETDFAFFSAATFPEYEADRTPFIRSPGRLRSYVPSRRPPARTADRISPR